MYRRRFSNGKVFAFDVAVAIRVRNDGRSEGLWDFNGT